MEFLNVMPNSVMKPMREPRDRAPPVAKTTMTPPTKANGRFARTSRRFRVFIITTESRRMMPKPDRSEKRSKSRRDCACAAAVPVNSMYVPVGNFTFDRICFLAVSTKAFKSPPETFKVTVCTLLAPARRML